MKCIGLFGTCGGSAWRAPFIERYIKLGIEYFNPQVDDWTPELAKIEAKHLNDDEIIVFPITSETYGTGSLCETGFSILQTLKNQDRKLLIFVDPNIDQNLMDANPVAAKESVRARKLVNAHLAHIKYPNIFVFTSIEEMLEKTIELYND